MYVVVIVDVSLSCFACSLHPAHTVKSISIFSRHSEKLKSPAKITLSQDTQDTDMKRLFRRDIAGQSFSPIGAKPLDIENREMSDELRNELQKKAYIFVWSPAILKHMSFELTDDFRLISRTCHISPS